MEEIPHIAVILTRSTNCENYSASRSSSKTTVFHEKISYARQFYNIFVHILPVILQPSSSSAFMFVKAYFLILPTFYPQNIFALLNKYTGGFSPCICASADKNAAFFPPFFRLFSAFFPPVSQCPLPYSCRTASPQRRSKS